MAVVQPKQPLGAKVHAKKLKPPSATVLGSSSLSSSSLEVLEALVVPVKPVELAPEKPQPAKSKPAPQIGIAPVEVPDNPLAYWQSLPEDAEISASITKTWTDQAIKCYMLQADCLRCSIPRGQYQFVCQMNKVVPVLLKTLNEPDTHRVEKLMPYLED